MTINYSPFYTANCFTGLEQKDGKVAFDEITVNESGLLAQLELRQGLSCPEEPHTKRLPRYYQAMRHVMNSHKDNILEASWQADALGTAKKCLEWRDSLVMSGWTADMKQPSERLGLLAEAEMRFDEKNALGDRWQKVVKALETAETVFDGETLIKVGLKDEHALQPLMAHVLSMLKGKGVSVELAEQQAVAEKDTDLGQFQQALLDPKNHNSITLKNDGTLRVLRFATENEASRYLVALSGKAQSTVYIAKNNMSLCYAQQMAGKPTSGCSVSSSVEHEMQLLPLAVELWASPYNVRSLMQWLQIMVHPLHPKLRSRLTRVLSSEGGRDNEKWNEAIDKFLEEADEETRLKMSARLEWALPRNKHEAVDKDEFTHFINELKKWADGRRHVEARKNAMLAHQLTTLSKL